MAVDLVVLGMMFIITLSNSAYSIIAPFMPFEFQNKGVDLSLMGYIFSIYSLAVIIASPLYGKYVS